MTFQAKELIEVLFEADQEVNPQLYALAGVSQEFMRNRRRGRHNRSELYYKIMKIIRHVILPIFDSQGLKGPRWRRG